MNRSKTIWMMLVAATVVLPSCHKTAYLDAKPSTSLFEPTTLNDFQALLDNALVINQTPVLGEVSSDNYYLLYNFFQTLSNIPERNAYIWTSDTYQGLGNIGDWDVPYQQVFYANVVLDGIGNVPVTDVNQQQWNAIKGAAYFVRAYAFYNIAQLFAPAYDSATAAGALGIPLRLTSAIDQPSTRASVKDTYARIIADLKQAAPLLPASIVTANRNRPCQPAVMAMLSRVYLSMREYAQAGSYADSSLRLYNTLIDYNTVSIITAPATPFSKFNNETMYQSTMLNTTAIMKGASVSSCVIDTNLYRSYASYDLRRSIFFYPTALPYNRGGYGGSIFLFSGLATDEMYLNRAECFARAGNATAAMSDLNTLMAARWSDTTTFRYTAASSADALNIILTERRKELPFRGLRWTDLRRLNKENYNITLTRVVNGQVYQLPSGDLRYVFLIPSDALTLGGLVQNPR